MSATQHDTKDSGVTEAVPVNSRSAAAAAPAVSSAMENVDLESTNSVLTKQQQAACARTKMLVLGVVAVLALVLLCGLCKTIYDYKQIAHDSVRANVPLKADRKQAIRVLAQYNIQLMHQKFKMDTDIKYQAKNIAITKGIFGCQKSTILRWLNAPSKYCVDERVYLISELKSVKNLTEKLTTDLQLLHIHYMLSIVNDLNAPEQQVATAPVRISPSNASTNGELLIIAPKRNGKFDLCWDLGLIPMHLYRFGAVLSAMSPDRAFWRQKCATRPRVQIGGNSGIKEDRIVRCAGPRGQVLVYYIWGGLPLCAGHAQGSLHTD